jgi:hypothetical protein
MAALLGLCPETLEAPRADMSGYWIVKPHYSVGGKGIVDWEGNNHHGKYLQRKIIKDREFRAHGFLWAKDKVPLIQEKTIGNKNQLCWNMKKGGSFKYVHEPAIGINKLDKDTVDRITNLSILALQRLKYDMGGVDLCMDESGELFILEVNSYWGQREMTMAATKMTFGELWNIDIDEYKRTRWLPKYRPIIEQPARGVAAPQEWVDDANVVAEMSCDTINPDGSPENPPTGDGAKEVLIPLKLESQLSKRASATMMLKGAAEAYLLEAKETMEYSAEAKKAIKLSELEDKVTELERKVMLAAGRKVKFRYNEGRRD